VSLEPPELATLKRGLGRQLAALREAAEIGQQQVARRTGYSRSSVAHAEAGRQLLTRDFWQTADELLKADGALLANYEQVRTAKQEHERQSRETELAEAYAAARALRATAARHSFNDASRPIVPNGHELMAGIASPVGIELAEGFATPSDYLTFLSSAARVVPGEQGDRIYDQLTRFLRQWADTMNRRELLQLFGWAATAIAVSPAMSGLDTEEQERLAQAIISPSRVDTRVIDHLATILRDCKAQDDVLGPRAVLHTVLSQRQLARYLLTECPAPLRPRLLAVYSGMSSSAGDYFFDLNDLESARYYYGQARAAAHEAGNTELSIYALCSMSYATSSQGKAHAGIDLAAAAQSLASKTDDPLLRVCAAERAGTAYAVDGQYKPCLTEFNKAQEGMLSAKDAPADSPAYYYHEGLLASHQSECLLLLEKPKEAAVSASTGLTVFNKSYVDGYALCTLHLGNAYLQAGEIDEAAWVIGNAANLAAQNRQARLVKELRTSRAWMQPWQGTRAIRELDERLAGCGVEVGA